MFRLLPPTLVLLAAVTATPVTAQDAPFQFSTDPEKLVNPRVDIDVRPNVREMRYLFLRNPGEEDRTYTVELRGPVGTGLVATGKVTFNRDIDAATNGYARVIFAKPAPPPPPPAQPPVAPPPPPPGAPPVKKVEVPPGVELVRTAVGENKLFQFTLRVYDDAGRPVLNERKQRVEQTITVGVRSPNGYMAAPVVTANVTEAVRQITADVATLKEFTGPDCPVVLDLPRQPALEVARLGPGAYRRVLSGPDQKVQLQAKDVPLASGSSTGTVRFNIDVDGYPRAYSYRVDFSKLSKSAVLQPINVPAVRIYPAAGVPDVTRYHVRPGSAFPVRVELDGPLPAGASVQLRVDRNGDNDFNPADEIIPLLGLRDEKVWIEPAFEDGAILVSTVVSDWVRDIDTRALQGEIQVQAVVVTAAGQVLSTEASGPISASLNLIVDNTPPERIDFAKLPEQHVKGTPLPVAVKVFDPELTPVKKASFYIGRPNEDGKAPEGAALIPAVVDPKDPTIWRAELPLPPDRKGELFVSVQVDTVVGFGAYATQRVLLVDAPPPAGAVTGTVTLAGRKQADLVVVLSDAEGKPKAATKTKEDGTFKFEGIPPGVYAVTSEKPDSVSKMVGTALVQVEVGKTVDVAVALSRPKPKR